MRPRLRALLLFAAVPACGLALLLGVQAHLAAVDSRAAGPYLNTVIPSALLGVLIGLLFGGAAGGVACYIALLLRTPRFTLRTLVVAVALIPPLIWLVWLNWPRPQPRELPILPSVHRAPPDFLDLPLLDQPEQPKE